MLYRILASGCSHSKGQLTDKLIMLWQRSSHPLAVIEIQLQRHPAYSNPWPPAEKTQDPGSFRVEIHISHYCRSVKYGFLHWNFQVEPPDLWHFIIASKKWWLLHFTQCKLCGWFLFCWRFGWGMFISKSQELLLTLDTDRREARVCTRMPQYIYRISPDKRAVPIPWCDLVEIHSGNSRIP